jgi:hypothetical protein
MKLFSVYDVYGYEYSVLQSTSMHCAVLVVLCAVLITRVQLFCCCVVKLKPPRRHFVRERRLQSWKLEGLMKRVYYSRLHEGGGACLPGAIGSIALATHVYSFSLSVIFFDRTNYVSN